MQIENSLRSRSTLRKALLGAAATIALAGVATQFAPPASFANAQTVNTTAALNHQAVPAVGPASFADLVDRVKGAVVSVKVRQTEKVAANDDGDFGPGAGPQSMERFLRRFGEGGGAPAPRQGQGLAMGSGFIISPDGYVVTNNHVVDNASEVEIALDGGKSVQAKVVGVDPKTDLALLKIKDGGPYPFVQFGDRAPRVGDWVVAVGNPFGLGGTVTAGIVSARGRDIGSGPYDDYLQIDAPVNRGNSGGPTFDAAGQVVGVNTAIFSPSGGSVGIGFAIPSEVAKNVIAALKDKGTVARGYLGVQIQPVTQDIADSLGLKAARGALVAEANGGPATDAGLKSGDVILAVNGEAIEGPRELARKIAALGPQGLAKITYSRGGTEKTAEVKLGAQPGERMARAGGEKSDSGALASLGLRLDSAAGPDAREPGARVVAVNPEGPAAAKGLRPGDVIVNAGGKAVAGPADVAEALRAAKADGRKALLLQVRNAQGTRFVALSATA